MDATDEFTVSGLPLKDTDIVIVAIGEDQGANIMATAVFKNLRVKRLISRALNPLHEKVLLAIGVDDIVHPEEETAERWAKKLNLYGLLDSFELNENYSIVEALAPSKCVGKTLQELDVRKKYNLLILTTIKNVEVKSIIGKVSHIANVQGVASASLLIEKDDILVIYGQNTDIKKFITQ